MVKGHAKFTQAGFDLNGAQGRSLPVILTYATPVLPCTMESNHRHANFQNEVVFNVIILNQSLAVFVQYLMCQ